MSLSGIKRILFLDFETYYAQTYTLRTLTIPEYLLDPRYETIMCACAVNDEPSHIVDGPDFGAWISQFDPETTATVTFNALFDNAILAWHYGWVPKLMLDSMNLARALRGHILPRLNLETCCKVLGFTHDKSTILKVQNMRRADIIARSNMQLVQQAAGDPFGTPTVWQEFCDYANRDNEGSRFIFKQLIGELPSAERKLMDLVIRCAVQPRFLLDRPVLTTHLAAVRNKKIDLLNACQPPGNPKRLLYGCPPQQIKDASKTIGLMSAPQFQKVLEAFGVEVQYKPSPADPTKKTPAFAKIDAFMEELGEHPDVRVQALVAARLGLKSTQEETRTEKLIAISSLAWDNYRDGNPRLYSGGTMPIPLTYSGAHTHRLSGTWRLNMQNLPRGTAKAPPMLRKGLVAPPGHMIIAGDLAQIEARLVAWLAGCTPLLAEFARKGGDPYSAFASTIFGMPIDRKYVDPVTGVKPYAVHGFIGKTGVLGLGYQCGDEKFFHMVQSLARLQGIDLASVVPWTMALATCTVHGYRSRYHQIPALWSKLQNATQMIWSQYGNQEMRVGPVTIRYAEIEGPNGMKMKYYNPRFIDGEYIYTYGWGTYKMYGGKMLENITQFLARIIIMNAALRLNDLGYRFVLQAHDELVFIVPNEDLDNATKIIYRELVRPPSWGRDIPLEAEVKSGPSYGDCK
jgi:DNA polymerase